jgi:hypothetical protein
MGLRQNKNYCNYLKDIVFLLGTTFKLNKLPYKSNGALYQ